MLIRGKGIGCCISRGFSLLMVELLNGVVINYLMLLQEEDIEGANTGP